MSMQQSGGVVSARGASPGQQSVGESRPWHIRRNAAANARRERMRQEVAEAIALGVEVAPKLQVDRTRKWEPWEVEVIRANASDMRTILRLLPGRSHGACAQMRLKLGFAPRFVPWKLSEERLLRENYLKVGRAGELVALLPGRTREAISQRLMKLGLFISPPAADTGSPVVDAIKERCRLLGYTMADLDRMAASGRYFRGRKWKQGHRGADGRRVVTQVSPAMARAVQALGGAFRIEWPDDGESIDTIDVGEG